MFLRIELFFDMMYIQSVPYIRTFDLRTFEDTNKRSRMIGRGVHTVCIPGCLKASADKAGTAWKIKAITIEMKVKIIERIKRGLKKTAVLAPMEVNCS